MQVVTPVNWNKGDDVIIHAAVNDQQAKELFPDYKAPLVRIFIPYLDLNPKSDFRTWFAAVLAIRQVAFLGVGPSDASMLTAKICLFFRFRESQKGINPCLYDSLFALFFGERPKKNIKCRFPNSFSF